MLSHLHLRLRTNVILTNALQVLQACRSPGPSHHFTILHFTCTKGPLFPQNLYLCIAVKHVLFRLTYIYTHQCLTSSQSTPQLSKNEGTVLTSAEFDPAVWLYPVVHGMVDQTSHQYHIYSPIKWGNLMATVSCSRRCCMFLYVHSCIVTCCCPCITVNNVVNEAFLYTVQ